MKNWIAPFALLLALSACRGTMEATPEPAREQSPGETLSTTADPTGDLRRIDLEEFRRLLAEGRAVPVDVRLPVIHEISHLPGAISAPVGLLDQRRDQLPTDKLLVAYCTCRSEELSLAWMVEAAKRGITNTAALVGGYEAWKNAGLPLKSTRDLNVPRPSTIESPGSEEQPPAVGRIGAPEWLPCDRSDVNGYIGRVIRYERRAHELVIEIHTDWDTTEVVTLDQGPSRVAEHFRIDGEPFRESDWSRIEQSEGKVIPNTRVRAWVCQAPGNPTVIDWRPGEITPPNPY